MVNNDNLIIAVTVRYLSSNITYVPDTLSMYVPFAKVGGICHKSCTAKSDSKLFVHAAFGKFVTNSLVSALVSDTLVDPSDAIPFLRTIFFEAVIYQYILVPDIHC